MSRILFSCTELHSHGGIQRFNRNLVQAWVELGANVDIVSVNDNTQTAGYYAGVKNVRCFYAGRHKGKWLQYVGSLMARERYDTYVCGHINLLPAFALIMAVARRSFTKSILILHGIEVWGRVTGMKRIAASRIACVLGVSCYTVSDFLGQMGAFPENRTAVFPNTINPELAQRIPDLSRRGDRVERLRLLSVSRLDTSERDKGIMDVIRALAELKSQVDFEYVIVGDGNDRKFLADLAESLGLGSRVVFRGAVSDDALWRAYEDADVFVLPSRKEGFGIVFLEAMYFGLPVIGAAEKGALDVVEQGVNGFLVDYGDVDQIAVYLLELARHPERRAQMAEQGRATVTDGGRFGFNAFRDRANRYFLTN